MQADNDNLAGLVEGFDDWTALHEAAQRVVADCARQRAQPATELPGLGRMPPGGQTELDDGGRHHFPARGWHATS